MLVRGQTNVGLSRCQTNKDDQTGNDHDISGHKLLVSHVLYRQPRMSL